MNSSFWEFNVGHVITLALVVIGYIQYRVDQRNFTNKAEATKTEMIASQARLHVENQQRLMNLANFHEDQMEINRKRDDQIHELRLQTATLGEISKALNRRVEMMENRRAS